MISLATPARLLLGAALGVAVLTGCNKKPDDVPTPQTVTKTPTPPAGADPDLSKPGDTNPGGTPATPAAPDPHSTAQPPSSTTSTNQ